MVGLIIDDEKWVIPYFREALESLGIEVQSITADPRMPPQDEVFRQIESADVIVLDNDLKTDYTGEDLLGFCQRTGKKVVGISSMKCFGDGYFPSKDFFALSSERSAVIKQFQEVVKEVISWFSSP